jgi:ubiquinone/menaquinone biosynthesis C-methylase UbiE
VDRSDLHRLTEEYRLRDKSSSSEGGHWQAADPAVQYLVEQRQRILREKLEGAGIVPEKVTALDVGCGGGYELGRLAEEGFRASHLFGIDYLRWRVETAVKTFPQFQFAQADGSRLPFANHSFDLVTQFTAFSSLTDAALKQAMAAEMWRVLRPGGWVLWFDMRPLDPTGAKLGRAAHFAKRNWQSPQALLEKARKKLFSPKVVVPQGGEAAPVSTTVIPIGEAELRRLFPQGRNWGIETTGLYFALVGPALRSRTTRVLEHFPRLHTHILAMTQK